MSKAADRCIKTRADKSDAKQDNPLTDLTGRSTPECLIPSNEAPLELNMLKDLFHRADSLLMSRKHSFCSWQLWLCQRCCIPTSVRYTEDVTTNQQCLRVPNCLILNKAGQFLRRRHMPPCEHYTLVVWHECNVVFGSPHDDLFNLNHAKEFQVN